MLSLVFSCPKQVAMKPSVNIKVEQIVLLIIVMHLFLILFQIDTQFIGFTSHGGSFEPSVNLMKPLTFFSKDCYCPIQSFHNLRIGNVIEGISNMKGRR